MKPCYELNFKGNFLLKNITIPKNIPIPKVPVKNVWNTTLVRPNYYISDEGKEYLNNIGFRIDEIIFFIGNAHSQTEIHTDGKNQTYAINYVWGSSDSEASWYNVIENMTNNPTLKFKSTYPSISYHLYSPNQVQKIYSQNCFEKLYLFRTNIPHRVKNNGAVARYCLSLRTFSTNDKWENIVEYYKNNIVN